MSDLQKLASNLEQRFADALISCQVSAQAEVTIELQHPQLIEVCTALRDEPEFGFEEMIDCCGVDYGAFGQDEWGTQESSATGFSRGVERRMFQSDAQLARPEKRFAVVYHLLSIRNNQRLRVRIYAPDDSFPVVASVTGIWASANWFEREVFDLFGIIFDGHPDLRRILTDYGFIGHPFRKDFPLGGQVEMRYDPDQQRVIYVPVTLEPRIGVPKVIRDDHRYTSEEQEDGSDA